MVKRLDALSHDASNISRFTHAILSGLAFLFFVIGAMGLRLIKNRHIVAIHGWWQFFSTVVLLAGFGLAVWLCQLPRSPIIVKGTSGSPKTVYPSSVSIYLSLARILWQMTDTILDASRGYCHIPSSEPL